MKIDKRKLLFCGDSLVDENAIKNVNLYWNWENHWSSLVSKNLNAPYINTAVCGDTIANIRNNIDQRILQHNPSFVFIGGGVNDCGNGASTNTTQTIMKEVIQTLLDNGIQVGLLWFPVSRSSWSAYNPVSDFITLPTKYKAIADEFHEKFPDSFCFFNLEGKNGLGTTQNDAYTSTTITDYRIDGLHFNPAGQKLIAEHILEMISSIDTSISLNGAKGSRLGFRYFCI